MAYKRPRALSPSDSQKRPRGGAANYVLLGTALPDDDGDDGAFVPVWKQTVTDERGRRRLHGAFTGGFSAGYFNTVGSKEGWTPKTFVSSRANRAKNQQQNAPIQRAEDFMDEEDLAAAAESRQLETAQGFAGIGDAGQDISDGMFGLFLSQEDTMGVKIAQKMGWRRDQGIGRKIRRDAYTDDREVGTNASSAHLFAPQDARMMAVPREEVGRKGLGYTSEARLGAEDKEVLRQEPTLHFLENSKKPSIMKKPVAKKSSFGVGVLNDTGSDDEDPYELGPKIIFNKTLGKEKKAKKPSKFAKAGLSEKHMFVSKKGLIKDIVPRSQISHDGRPPLDGFILGRGIVDQAEKPRYPPLKLPPGWKSARVIGSAADPSTYQSTADAAKASTLDAKGRSALLGETPLPGKSVFDFISKNDRDRLAALSGKSHLPQGLGQAAPEGHLPVNQAAPKDLWSLVPSLDKSLAAGALAKGATGWMPYAEDLQKRKRYIGFLELRAGLQDGLPEQPNGISVTDWVKELQEFAHAAQVFKPTTGIMASRFTSSSSSMSQPIASEVSDGESLLRQPLAKPEDSAEQAANLGMYGAMTRSSFAFHPPRLLCKRFNVKPPPDMPPDLDHNEASFAKSQTEQAVSKSAMDKMIHEVLTNGPSLQRPAWMGGAKPSPEVSSQPQPLEHAKVDVENNEALTREKAPEDVFKAIFGDDSDED